MKNKNSLEAVRRVHSLYPQRGVIVMNLTDQIIRYEAGELDQEETVELFRQLIATGLIYQLQGHYQRTARNLQQQGVL